MPTLWHHETSKNMVKLYVCPHWSSGEHNMTSFTFFSSVFGLNLLLNDISAAKKQLVTIVSAFCLVLGR